MHHSIVSDDRPANQSSLLLRGGHCPPFARNSLKRRNGRRADFKAALYDTLIQSEATAASADAGFLRRLAKRISRSPSTRKSGSGACSPVLSTSVALRARRCRRHATPSGARAASEDKISTRSAPRETARGGAASAASAHVPEGDPVDTRGAAPRKPAELSDGRDGSLNPTRQEQGLRHCDRIGRHRTRPRSPRMTGRQRRYSWSTCVRAATPRCALSAQLCSTVVTFARPRAILLGVVS